jgi:two-component system cell cycle response regulator CtrA
MRAIVVEDEAMTAKAITLALSKEGYVCDWVSVGAEALEVARICSYDIMILDLKLSGGIDGYELLARLRAAKVRIPILILSGLAGTEQKVRGLGFGADDYLTKPYNRSELIARLQAIIRRSKGHPESVIRIGSSLCINLDSRTVECSGKPVHLTSKEYAILELLALRAGTILNKTMFLNHLYGGMDEPELKIIDVFVCKLRKKLAKATGGDGFIETVWGRGYVLNKRDTGNNLVNYGSSYTPLSSENKEYHMSDKGGNAINVIEQRHDA